MPMGTLRPIFWVNSTVGIRSSGALTNETNRESFSGSSRTPFHSHEYPSTCRATASSKSAANPASVADHVPQMVDAAVQTLDPRRRALQTIRGPQVEHQEAVDVADQCLVVEIGCEQIGVFGVMPPLPQT